MAQIREIRLDSWWEFKRDLVSEFIDADSYRHDAYLFRGMRSPRWQLESSFDRTFRHVEPDRRTQVFDDLVATFREACRDYGLPAELCDDDRRLIALGQHHGLPTRLLDWTSSPYIAAFFAYQEAFAEADAADSHVVLWVLHRRSPMWSGVYDVEIVAAPSHENARARNQAGYYTLSRSPFNCLEEVVIRCTDVTGVALTRVLLPLDDVRTALADLDLMGISALRLFPDLTGAATACKIRMLLEQG
ncbi:FRG domain-containing protein [Dactylosporangium sp. McL0621]|uniref:FRG domain-containing protein n=1 Tax=Dactylosporangium sp. McL0621 TaxID=3415678 RepID=UPI003CEA6708